MDHTWPACILSERALGYQNAKQTSRPARKAFIADLTRDFFSLWKSYDDEVEEWRAIAAKNGATFVAPIPIFPTHDDWYKCREPVRIFSFILNIILMILFPAAIARLAE